MPQSGHPAGPHNWDAIARAARDHLWRPWAPASLDPAETILLVAGEGCYVFDASGRRLIDARSGPLSASCGYACKPILDAITSQAAALMTADLSTTTTAPAALLARKYSELLPAPLERTFFATSGSEATETAIKLARMYHALHGEPRRRTIISLRDGYHGATLGALSASPSRMTQYGNEPLPAGFVAVPTPRCIERQAIHGHEENGGADAGQDLAETIEREGPKTIAAFVVEPVLGVGGVIVLPGDYLRRVREICSEAGVILIVDEVMTGFGRTGRMFAFEHSGVVPDILTTSKGVTGGYAPLSAVTAASWIYEAFSRDELLGGFRHGHTNSGHPIACAAALAAIDTIEREGLVENAARVGRILLDELRALLRFPCVRDIRGLGLLIGIEIDEGGRDGEVARRALDLGLIVRQQDSVITLCPPLTLPEPLAYETASILRRAVADFEATR